MTASSARDARTLTNIEKLLDEGYTFFSAVSADGLFWVELQRNFGERFIGWGNDLGSALTQADDTLKAAA